MIRPACIESWQFLYEVGMGVLKRTRMQEIPARLEEIGRLFKGGPKEKGVSKSGKEYLGYGKDLDCFRFQPSERLMNLPSSSHVNLYEEVLARWQGMQQVTAGWKAIPILLPYRSLAENFRWRNAVYDGSGRTVRSCDGELCDRQPFLMKNAHGKEYTAILRGAYACAMQEGDVECPAGCKAEAKLSMIIPGFPPGLVVLTTKSTIDIQTIEANLKAYSRFDLSRIPMRLCRSLKDASYTDAKTGEFKKQEKWLCHIEIDPEYGQMALQAQQQQYRAELMGGVQDAPQLPSTSKQIAAAPNGNIERLTQLRTEFGLSKDECRTIASSIGLNTSDASSWTAEQCDAFEREVRAMGQTVQAEVVE